jgi:hypothetical protein
MIIWSMTFREKPSLAPISSKLGDFRVIGGRVGEHEFAGVDAVLEKQFGDRLIARLRLLLKR